LCNNQLYRISLEFFCQLPSAHLSPQVGIIPFRGVQEYWTTAVPPRTGATLEARRQIADASAQAKSPGQRMNSEGKSRMPLKD
jgi:hypothetical protein